MSNYEKDLKEMYELGVEHGRELARKDFEIELLTKQIEQLSK